MNIGGLAAPTTVTAVVLARAAHDAVQQPPTSLAAPPAAAPARLVPPRWSHWSHFAAQSGAASTVKNARC